VSSNCDPIADSTEERGPGYRQITRALLDDIRNRTWKIGDQLPTEAELVDRFGASRSTIRESLRELAEQGYITRRRGARSVLSAVTPMFVNRASSVEKLLQYSLRTIPRILTSEIVVAGFALAERLRVPVGSEWLRVEILRLSRQDGEPIGFSEIFVHPRYADITDGLAEVGVIYRMLEERHGVFFSQVDQEIEPKAASANVASRLAVPVDSPTLQVRTDFVASTGEVVEIGFGHFPAGRYKLKFGLIRGGGIAHEEDAP
jgi:DNA-binding GntR family transcriptional regulator